MSLSYAIYYSQNTFVAIVDLPEGEHQYKFYVDGQWTHDPAEVSSYPHTCDSEDSCDIITQFPCMFGFRSGSCCEAGLSKSMNKPTIAWDYVCCWLHCYSQLQF